MTVLTLNNRVSYPGTGSQTVFSFPNRFLLDADIVVYQKVDTTGVATLKALTTHYTLTGAGGASGGNVTMLVAPPTGETLVILRDPALTQLIDLVNGDNLNVETGIERGLDRDVLAIQRLRDIASRSLRLSDADTSGVSVILPTPVANKTLGWNATATAIENKDPTAGASLVSPFIATLLDDTDQTIARATLGAVGTTGNETVAGVKAFTGANTHTGAETHTGIETFPTAAAGTNTQQAATTAFVNSAIRPNWIRAELKGSGLAITTVGLSALAALNGTDVAFVDAINDSLRTYRFDGTNWAQVGAELAIATVGNPALAALNSTDVAFIDETNDSLRTYRFDGTNWAQVGASLAITPVGNTPALAALNSTNVAFVDATNDSLRTYRFDGTNWAQVGASLAIATVSFPALAALNGTDVAFIDEFNDSLRTYRFAYYLGSGPYHP